MKSIYKTLFIVLIILFMIPISSYAIKEKPTDINDGGSQGGKQSHTAGEIVTEAEGFIEAGSGNSPIKKENLQELSNTIYNILLAVGIVIAIAVGGILGIKFMTGGIDGQVEVKKMMIPYIAGCVVIFGAFTIWKIVLLVLQ